MQDRMRPNDIVECDGICSKVASIGNRTTMIETIDGSIITFQNSQIFNRNFSNMTKNHLDEFGDSAVNLCISVWVPVRTEPIALSAVREAIYKTFNAHSGEIPFPQQDLYIKTEPEKSSISPGKR